MHHLFAILAALCQLLSAPLLAQPNLEVQDTTVYLNANIYTVDAQTPRAEALAVRDGRVLAVGSRLEVIAAAGVDARIEDLQGRTVLPGFIDAHGHVIGLGSLALGQLDLRDTRSFEQVLEAVAQKVAASRPGDWILGGRWDNESWDTKDLPRHGELSKLSPDNPLWLTRVDGHAGIANAKALELAGITRDTPSPPGGEILKDPAGEPTGVLVDNAAGLVERLLAGHGADAASAILAAQDLCLSAGLTGVHDAGVSAGEAAVYRALERDGKLKLRVYAMIHAAEAESFFASSKPVIGPRFTLRAAKLYADGAMGSRGAWLLEPYADRPLDERAEPYTGLAVSNLADIERIARDGLARGYQVCTHAIGDRANREVLDAYERALPGPLSDAPLPDHRFRIEHAQLLSPQDIPRFAALGVIASMQPTHCTSDMRWVDDRVGPHRAAGAYAWASLLRSGAVIAAGSDFPVESHEPLLGFYAAVTRRNPDGYPPEGWRREECMTREEALRSFTLDAAYAAFEETDKGSLSRGKRADFIILDRDIMTCREEDILKARVLRTVIGGETVFQSPP